MKYSELAVLLPCHSLEDFPVYHEGPEADELLTAWSAPWHPALLAAAESLPTWHRLDSPPDELEGRLLVVPPFCVDRLPAGYLARASSAGAVVVRERERAAAVAAALVGVGNQGAAVGARLAGDFLALGFCRLQIELLTRQMRYSMYIDETHFQTEALAAARAAVAGDEVTARQHLALCYETLYDARKHFYPVDMHLLDITLVAPTTVGSVLAETLAAATPTNLLAPGESLTALAAEPATWSALLKAIDEGRACLVGSERDEGPWPVLPLEACLESLRAGSDRYEQLIGRRPIVYGRRRAGLWPVLPQLLVKLGYVGALHFTLDDGRFPLAAQAKTRWEGLDTSVIDVLDRVPHDAAKPQTFLALSRHLADTMDSDHVATLAIAHWPGPSSTWYDDLRRIAELSPVLGKFTLLDDYFNHTAMPGRLSKFTPDEYRTPYLKQAIIRRQPNPLSTIVAAHRQQAERLAAEAVTTMAAAVRGRTRAGAEPTTNEPGLPVLLEELAALLPKAADAVAERQLIVNPLSFGIQASASPDSTSRPTAEVPAMGFAWAVSGAPSPSRAKPAGHERTITNEFFELTVSEKTGGIQSLYNFSQRGNQLSQQLALRFAGADPETAYTTMRAESVELTHNSPAGATISSRGVLIDSSERRVAGFHQIVRAAAGSRIVTLDIELDVADEPRADPWNSYYAARFAWPDATTELWRGVGLLRQKTSLGRFEAPEFIDIDSGASALTLLTGGLPYHRRSDERMLDTLLVVRGETARRFQLAIGVGLAQPAAAAIEFLTPPATLTLKQPAPTAPSGWFFHVGAKNLLATHWQPLVDETAAPGPDGSRAVRGFRARLLETGGQAGRTTLRAFRAMAAARQVDFIGQTLVTLPVDGDKMTIDYGAGEWIEIEATWS